MPHETDADRPETPGDDVSMEEWLDGHEHRSLGRGDIVRGVVVHVGEEGLLVDVGAKSEGIVPASDLDQLDDETVAALQEGEQVLVYCVTPQDRDGNILLSVSSAQVARDWERALEMYDAGEVFQSRVGGHNKGGVIVYLGKVRGFVPASQLARRRQAQYQRGDANQPWSQLLGEELWLKVIECDVNQNRLILSEQAALRQRRKSMREELLAKLSEGDVLTGEVTSLADFGAFVDLGGADGLIHISELSWDRVNHPSDILNIGDEVEVQVISIDETRKRIGLSMKRLKPEPWEVIDQRFKVGDLVQGTITKLTSFGAFAKIDGGIEGLIHISELTDQLINHPSEVVRGGDEVTLRIIRIEPDRRRIGLSLRQVDDERWSVEDEASEAGLEEEAGVDEDEVEAGEAVIEGEVWLSEEEAGEVELEDDVWSTDDEAVEVGAGLDAQGHLDGQAPGQETDTVLEPAMETDVE
ncbi:MAG: 30S ribosomal protein S1 [Anaerolineae bacterium]